MGRKKVSNMDAVLERTEPIVGTREFRNKMADYMNKVIDKKQIFKIGRKFRPQESATIIPSEILDLALNTNFHSKVYFDEVTNQYSAEIEDFLGGGVGDTAEDAIEMALDNMEALVEHFFGNINWYLQDSEYREKLPKYLKLRLADSREQLAKILDLR